MLLWLFKYATFNCKKWQKLGPWLVPVGFILAYNYLYIPFVKPKVATVGPAGNISLSAVFRLYVVDVI